jgi:hypothetical protein
VFFKIWAEIKLSEDTFWMNPNVTSTTITQTWFTSKKSDQSEYYTMTNSDTSLPKLLMFRDSFTIAMQSFLADRFNRSVFIRDLPNNEAYYVIERPDVVIIELSEKFLAYGLGAIPN